MQQLGEIVLNAAQIQAGVAQVAARLNAQYRDAVVVSVVPGGILFTADLVRALTFAVRMETISCPHTPGERNNRSDIIFHDHIGIRGQHVILIDDAIESGGTMKRLVAFLVEHFQPESIAIATLFVKPGRVGIACPQYYAYEMESDDLLVGYGLPWENKLRNLPFVAKLAN